MDFTNFSTEALLQSVLDFLPNLGLALLILLVSRFISRWGTRVVRAALEKRKRDPELIVLLELFTRWGILGVGIVWAIEQLAPGRFGTLLAGLGVVGISLGFALQDIAKNFLAGILLLLTSPFNLGDTIQVSGFTGKVLAINFRSTELREVDGRFVIIPNADVFINPIVNFSRAPRRRASLPLGITIDTDLDAATQAAFQAVSGIPGFIDDPGPQLLLEAFQDSIIQGTLFYWVDSKNFDFTDAQTAGAKAVNEAFKAAGLGMPYPTVEVTMLQGE
jgi:small conductance mechanosensitive channel